jgi:hypothetical protein
LAFSRSDLTMLQFAFAIALALALLIAGNMPALVEAVLLPFLSPSAAWLIGALIFRRVGRSQIASATGGFGHNRPAYGQRPLLSISSQKQPDRKRP